jgi:hypothetical protein
VLKVVFKNTTAGTTNSEIAFKICNYFTGGGMMKAAKRKTRSDKFLLTLHPSGQYCKKIKGRIY